MILQKNVIVEGIIYKNYTVVNIKLSPGTLYLY